MKTEWNTDAVVKISGNCMCLQFAVDFIPRVLLDTKSVLFEAKLKSHTQY